MSQGEEFTYKHYLLGDTVPIRILIAKSNGLKAGAQIPDPTTGKLQIANTYLSRVEESPEVEEIDEAEFHRRCQIIFSRKLS